MFIEYYKEARELFILVKSDIGVIGEKLPNSELRRIQIPLEIDQIKEEIKTAYYKFTIWQGRPPIKDKAVRKRETEKSYLIGIIKSKIEALEAVMKEGRQLGLDLSVTIDY
jgi:hypothetical protein